MMRNERYRGGLLGLAVADVLGISWGAAAGLAGARFS
jgi:ADP-ribosylglycohydrolase